MKEIPSLYIYKNKKEKRNGIKDRMDNAVIYDYAIVTKRFDAVYIQYRGGFLHTSYHITHDELLNKKSFIEKQKYIVYVVNGEATASEKEIFNSIDNNISCNVK